jgi:methionyl-tRNA formyltransferase
VHQAAELLGIPVFTPVNFKDPDERARFAEHKADVAVVVAYGLLLPEAILNGTRYGCYNGHASLLPRWRGAAPIQRAIMAGDEKTGMMVMKMDKGLDTGAVAISSEVAIGENMTGGELHDKLMYAGAKAMAEAMVKLEMDDLPLTPQPDEGVLYASKIDKSETHIDFSKDAAEVHNHIRGMAPFPGAWFELEISGKPERVKVLGSERAEGTGTPGELLTDDLVVACGTGAVRLTRLQKAGGKPLAAADFLRGTHLPQGTRLA